MKEQLGVKVDAKVKERIQKMVDAGEYSSISEFVNQAIQYFLARGTEEEEKRIESMMMRIINRNPELKNFAEKN